MFLVETEDVGESIIAAYVQFGHISYLTNRCECIIR